MPRTRRAASTLRRSPRKAQDTWSEAHGFASAEARTVLTGLLHALPTERDRRIIQLRFVEGLTQSEIARHIGVSQVQVSRLLRTNLDRMRAAATRQGRRAYAPDTG
jgi:RNA polymerase sigma factor (sigma-70 family)